MRPVIGAVVLSAIVGFVAGYLTHHLIGVDHFVVETDPQFDKEVHPPADPELTPRERGQEERLAAAVERYNSLIDQGRFQDASDLAGEAVAEFGWTPLTQALVYKAQTIQMFDEGWLDDSRRIPATTRQELGRDGPIAPN